MATKYPVTNEGELLYPYILEPDYEFDSAGVYHTKLVLPLDNDAQELIDSIDQAQQKIAEDTQKKTGRRVKMCPYMPYSVDTEALTVTLKFKMKAQGKTRDGKEFTQKPVVRAPDNSELTIRPGRGSKAKVAFEIVSFYNAAQGAGVQLRLRGVKVTDLVLPQAGGYNFFGDEDTPTNNNNFGDF